MLVVEIAISINEEANTEMYTCASGKLIHSLRVTSYAPLVLPVTERLLAQ